MVKLTLTLKPRRRSLRLAAKRQQARHQPYPARRTSGSLPTPPPQPRASSPVIKQESRASSPTIKREASHPPPTIIPFTPINKQEVKPKKDDSSSSPSSQEEHHHHQHNWDIPLHAIPQYFPALGPNTGSEIIDPRYVPGNFVVDERGVERRVLGRGEVASLTTMECWENGDLF